MYEPYSDFLNSDSTLDPLQLEETIKKYEDLNQPITGQDGKRPLHVAAERGDIIMVRMLLAHGAEVDSCDGYRNTPLHSAAKKGYHEVAEVLIDKGAVVSTKNAGSSTPLHEAACYGHYETVRLLLNRGGSQQISDKDYFSFTPLHRAAAGPGYHETVKILLSGKTDVSVKTFAGDTALHIAAEAGNHEIVELLLNEGASLSDKDFGGNTPLHNAAQSGSCETVQLLLDRGAKVSEKNKSGNTPLHKCQSKQVAEILIRNGASVGEKNNFDELALHCVHNHKYARSDVDLTDITEFLIIKGANVNRQDKDGSTPLHCAVKGRRNLELVRLLLNYGALHDIQNKSGETPLHWARYEAAVLLLEKGVELDVQDFRGMTALHRAACCGDIDLVMALLAYGFSLSVKNEYGKTPYRLVQYDQFRLKCKTLIESHIRLSSLAGLQVDEDMYQPDYLTEEELGEREKAVEELKRIKQTEVLGQFSLYEIFARSKRPRYLRTESIVEEIELIFQSPNFHDLFPMYANILKGTFNRSKRRSKYSLTRKATRSMMSDSRKKCCQLTPDLVWEQVFEFLSYEDMTNIIHSEL